MRTHWYWQDVANEIVKWHLGLVEVSPRFKFWKKWNWPYLWTLLVYFDKHLHTHYYWHDLDRGIAKSSPRDCKMTYNIGRGRVELQILKKWKWPNWADNCNETLYTHWYWQDVAQEIVKCHLGLAEAMPRYKFWRKKKQWNWPCLLKRFEYFNRIMHKHCYWRELHREIAKCQFVISRGYAEVQILKTSESDPLSFWNILICICSNSEKSKTEKGITHKKKSADFCV